MGPQPHAILGNIYAFLSFLRDSNRSSNELDLGEPARVAESIAKMNLKYTVITSVARDDLKDGGIGLGQNSCHP